MTNQMQVLSLSMYVELSKLANLKTKLFLFSQKFKRFMHKKVELLFAKL